MLRIDADRIEVECIEAERIEITSSFVAAKHLAVATAFSCSRSSAIRAGNFPYCM
jgi:hypothetical protein